LFVCVFFFYYPDHYNKSCLLVNSAYPSGAPEFILDFQWGSFLSVFSFMCSFFLIIVWPFLLFILAIVMSGLLWFTDYDNFIGIFICLSNEQNIISVRKCPKNCLTVVVWRELLTIPYIVPLLKYLFLNLLH